jgi:hypothetical protein
MFNTDSEIIDKIVDRFYSSAQSKGIESSTSILASELLDLADNIDESDFEEVEVFVNLINDIEICLDSEIFPKLKKEISEYKLLSNILSNAAVTSSIFLQFTNSQDEARRKYFIMTAQKHYDILMNYLEYTSVGENEYFENLHEPNQLFSYGELELIRYCAKPDFVSELINAYSQYDIAEKMLIAHILCNYGSDEVKTFLIEHFLNDDLNIEAFALTFDRMVTEGNKNLLPVAQALKDKLTNKNNAVNTDVLSVGLGLLEKGQEYLFDLLRTSDNINQHLASLHLLSHKEADRDLLLFAANYLIELHELEAWNNEITASAELSIKIMLSAKVSTIKKILADHNILSNLVEFLIKIDNYDIANNLCIFMRYNTSKSIECIQKYIDESPSYIDRKVIAESIGINIFINSVNYDIKESVNTFYIVPQY